MPKKLRKESAELLLITLLRFQLNHLAKLSMKQNGLEIFKKLTLMDEQNVRPTATVEITSTLMKLLSRVESVKETAEFVADASKCVAGTSTVFQLIVISARVVSM